MLETNDKYGFIIIDGNGVLFATVQGNSTNVLFRMSVSLPKKHRRGGQSSVRFARLRIEARHNYLVKVCELALKYFVDQASNKLNVRGIVTGGSGDLKEQLASAKELDPRVRAGILDTVDISYGFTQGLQQAIELSAALMKDVSLVKQKKLMSKFFEELQLDTGKCAYGIEDSLEALSSGAVETLMVWENLNITRFTLTNARSLETKVIHCKGDKRPTLENVPMELKTLWKPYLLVLSRLLWSGRT
eukprot:TRINITY_DN2366_c0_g1_i1.p1 TRINITY_DN2366_c0_g1~~TRINITY_DN2366_c0_g1_i1.p1  ORF type:complete len:246 (-),score=63.33 TRINITY_DN2366_c0_g1_i1:436-1173(-)